MKLLVGYLVLINLAGTLSMCIDKRHARKGRYRISERTLFTIAAAGGSIGSLLGMYIFHHKTRKRLFTIGIPLILLAQIFIVMVTASSFHAKAESPSAVVRQELDQLCSDNFALPEDLLNSVEIWTSLPDTEKAAFQDAASSFFQNFSYRIIDEQIKQDTAVVSVLISNLDTSSLAHDQSLFYSTQWIHIDGTETQPVVFSGYFERLSELIRSEAYEITESRVDFSLTLTGHTWKIRYDTVLADQITGGLLSLLSDPYLVTPEELLSCYMSSFQSLDSDGWVRFFRMKDLFSFGSPSYSEAADRKYADLLSKGFSWELAECTIDGRHAAADLKITSIDMEAVLSLYHDKLLEYAGTTESITSDQTAQADTAAMLLMESFDEAAAYKVFDASVTMFNDGKTWQLQDISGLTEAILGNISTAVQCLTE